MNRLIAFGLGLVCAGTAAAQYPVSPYTGTSWNRQSPPTAQPAPPPVPVRSVGAADVTQPLPTAVSAVLPATPPMPYGSGACVGGGCPPADCGRDGRPCLQRFKEWLCFQPGPACLPKCIPTPYRAPLRRYFPCPAECRAVVGGCNLTPCGPGECAGAGGLGLFRRNDCGAGPGIIDRLRSGGRCGPTCPPPVDTSYAPQNSTAPCYPPADECNPCWEPARQTVFDRVLSVFRPRRSECEPACHGYPTYPVPVAPVGAPISYPRPVAAPTAAPATGPAATLGPVIPTNLTGYRFAAPTPGRPFTNP
jgi:hypothetical protein